MFNNAIKKIAAAGLVFSLCVPCCFASAQKMPRNIFNQGNSEKNKTSSQSWGNFNPFLRAMQQAAQPAQPQPSALEQLWDIFYSYIMTNGYVISMGNGPIISVDDLARTVLTQFQDPVAAFLALSEVIVAKLAMPRELSLDLSRFAIHDIYSMNDEQYIDFLRRLLRRCGAPENELEICANALFEEYKSKYPN